MRSECNNNEWTNYEKKRKKKKQKRKRANKIFTINILIDKFTWFTISSMITCATTNTNTIKTTSICSTACNTKKEN